MLHKLYARLIALSATRLAPLWLALVSFTEASFFPLPPDLLLIPMILARPRRAAALAAICTGASVAGALLGYWIGAHLFNAIAAPVVHFYHAEAAYGAFLATIRRFGFVAILIKGLTPIPFKLVTIACGAAGMDIGPFLLACLITRGARFALLEALPLRFYGDRARDFIEHRLTAVTTAAAALLVGGFLALRFL